MKKVYTYKLQGDGHDSWTCEEIDDQGVLITKYMVYEDPNQTGDVSGVDIDSLSDEQLEKLKKRLGL